MTFRILAPDLRRPRDMLIVGICVVMTLYVIFPEVLGDGKTKDFPLWFRVGQTVISGGPLYDSPDFLYTPFAAILLAPITVFGKIPFYLLLLLANSLVLWMAVVLSQKLAQGDRSTPQWANLVPILITAPLAIENFDLGQPNIILLLAMLIGFYALQRDRPILSGAAFAFAVAVKVFPIAVLPYLIWRRHWRATASLSIFLVVFLVAIPSPIRGVERNLDELKTWAVSMVGSEDGFGQRESQNWSWKNASIYALTHRIVRPINYFAVSEDSEPAYMNLFELSYDQANLVVLAVAALLGLAFVAVMVPRRHMTPRAYADEIAILICLMTIVSPLARTYYFVWLLFPLTVLVQRIVDDGRPKFRQMGFAALGAIGLLTILSVFKTAQAYGVNTISTMLLAAALAVFMRRPDPEIDSSSRVCVTS